MCAVPVSMPQGRVPPHDLEAETSVLGAILLDPAAITRVLDQLSPDDFYRENNGQIYRAAQNLFREGEPIDNVTLAAALAKLGVLERVGGRAHLALLQESVPTAANVEHYARIVKDKAYKRQLISAGTQVTSLGYDESLDAEEAVNQAQAHVYAISDDKVGAGLEHIYSLLKPAMDRIDAQMASGGGVVGIPSGFHDLDRMTNGFKSADLAIIAGRPSMGKALALDTPVPTPDGWTTMGALRVGDRVFDDRGHPCAVTFVTPVMIGHHCYEVVLSDGERLVADAEHQWAVRDVDGLASVLTTRQLAAAPAAPDGWPRYSIATCGALRYRRRDLPADPYELGRRLGADGAPSGGGSGGTAVLEAPPVVRIPRVYLEAAVDQRFALLQGLVDASGGPGAGGRYEFRAGSQQLVEAVAELATGLGLSVRTGSRRVRFAIDPDARVRLVREVVPVQSVPVRCIQVDSPSHLYLAGRGCVPTHNTSFALNVTLHAAVEQKKPVAIFSLEMSKEQLVERMLCEQARIDAQRLHRGTLSDVEYERLAGALGPLGDAPIFIDDSPTLDDLTMRLKARQARSREGIELIVLDYLQLMQGRSSGGDANRVQEVSAISRALKSIARELRIPVIAISQLSRAPESRPDKRPILSDLRESGCMPASTRLLRADTGGEITLGELVLGQEQPQVWSVDSEWRLVPRRLVRAFPTGIRPVFRVRLASGHLVDATANHQFMTVTGWRRLDEVAPGEFLAVPRRVPAPAQQVRWDEDEVVLLAHLLGDGSIGLPGVRYATSDDANRQVVCDAARRRFGIEVRGDRIARTWQLWFPSPYRLTHGRHHPMKEWLDGLGLWGLRAPDKFVPEQVQSMPDDQLARFLRHLWATDGSITLSRNGRGQVVRIYYATTSRALVDGVRRALLRLDIRSRISRTGKEGYRDAWNLVVTGAENGIRFLTTVGCHGERGALIPECLHALCSLKPNPNVDLVPWVVAKQVRSSLQAAGVPQRQLAAALGERYSGSYLLGCEARPRRYSRDRLSRIAVIAADESLASLAASDVFWDEIVEITPLGEMPTFDATVEDTHNFIANGIVAHNSIEQDADIVMFLYRDDYYNREKSEKPGIAEVIVAKHRNGPTGSIELVFRKELTRFENLERRRPEAPGSE